MPGEIFPSGGQLVLGLTGLILLRDQYSALLLMKFASMIILFQRKLRMSNDMTLNCHYFLLRNIQLRKSCGKQSKLFTCIELKITHFTSSLYCLDLSEPIIVEV